MRRSVHDLKDEMLAVKRGEREPSPRPVGAVLAALSPEALELLGVTLREKPSSIAEVVRLAGRAQPNVSRSFQQLAGLGRVRLVRTGREVRPEALVREVRVDLADGTYTTKPVGL